jgi:hypothetical protein
MVSDMPAIGYSCAPMPIEYAHRICSTSVGDGCAFLESNDI